MSRVAKLVHRIILAMAAAYVLAVLLIVFWPTPVDRPAAGTLQETLSWLHRHGMPGFVNYNFVEFSANVAMFVPMGLIASAVFRKAWLGIVAGALASTLIELGQALLLPDRFASGLDVLANSMGSAVGAMLFVLLVAPRMARTAVAEAAPDFGPPHQGPAELVPDKVHQ